MWHCVHKAYNLFSIRQYSVSFGILIDYYERQSTYRLSAVSGASVSDVSNSTEPATKSIQKLINNLPLGRGFELKEFEMNKSYNRREVIKLAGAITVTSLTPTLLPAGNTFEVLMLNKDPDNPKKKMVFSPSLLKVSVGDTVSFLPEDKGHNSEVIKGMFPDGAEKWKGKLNKQVDVTFTVPGFYGYHCKPHANMGMIGLIVVEGNGKLDNLDTARNVKHRGKAKKAWTELWDAADEAGLTN